MMINYILLFMLNKLINFTDTIIFIINKIVSILLLIVVTPILFIIGYFFEFLMIIGIALLISIPVFFLIDFSFGAILFIGILSFYLLAKISEYIEEKKEINSI